MTSLDLGTAQQTLHDSGLQRARDVYQDTNDPSNEGLVLAGEANPAAARSSSRAHGDADTSAATPRSTPPTTTGHDADDPG